MNNLYRELAPISDAAWGQMLDDGQQVVSNAVARDRSILVRRVLAERLVARGEVPAELRSPAVDERPDVAAAAHANARHASSTGAA